MRSIFLIIGIAAILTVHSACADQLIATSQIRPLIEWIEARENVMLLPRPKIYVSDAALAKITGNNGLSANRGNERIAAYRNNTIFISQRYWQADDIADQSVLVHELVHAAQDRNGRTYDCAGQREEEAYRLQNEFLADHGQADYLDAEALEKIGRCS